MDIQEYLHLAPEAPGPVVRVNHNTDNCNGKSRSLSIWRNSDGSIGAKCYRCGEGARYQSKPSLFASVPKNKKLVYGIPPDIEYDQAKWPVLATAYINRFAFSAAHLRQRGIGWSASEERLIFPATNLTVQNPGWQGKSFFSEPRYLTRTKYPDYMYTHLCRQSPEVIITEDLLSAMRANEVLSSFALLGTTMNDFALSELRQYHKFYIWLDDDNLLVKKAQLKLYNTLSLHGEAFVIKCDREPKGCSSRELIEVIKSFDGTSPWG